MVTCCLYKLYHGRHYGVAGHSYVTGFPINRSRDPLNPCRYELSCTDPVWLSSGE